MVHRKQPAGNVKRCGDGCGGWPHTLRCKPSCTRENRSSDARRVGSLRAVCIGEELFPVFEVADLEGLPIGLDQEDAGPQPVRGDATLGRRKVRQGAVRK